jgi:hypothetical protein
MAPHGTGRGMVIPQGLAWELQRLALARRRSVRRLRAPIITLMRIPITRRHRLRAVIILIHPATDLRDLGAAPRQFWPLRARPAGSLRGPPRKGRTLFQWLGRLLLVRECLICHGLRLSTVKAECAA